MSVIVVSLQAMETLNNDPLSLIDMPLDIQRAIICAHSVGTTSITEANADALKEEIKNFFLFKKTCTYFREKFEWPWFKLPLEQKNKLMEEVNLFIKNLIYKEFDMDNRKSFSRHDEDVSYKYGGYWESAREDLFLPEFSQKVSSGYKKYRLILLMLVYSGVHPDTQDIRSTTCLSKAVHARDESGVALLLKCGANPLQLSYCEDYYAAIFLENSLSDKNIAIGSHNKRQDFFELVCRVPTMSMLNLFIQYFNSKEINFGLESLNPHIDPAVFKYWVDIGTKRSDWLRSGALVVGTGFIERWLTDYYLKDDDIENNLTKIDAWLDFFSVRGGLCGEETTITRHIENIFSQPSYGVLAYEPYGKRLVAMFQGCLVKISQKKSDAK